MALTLSPCAQKKKAFDTINVYVVFHAGFGIGMGCSLDNCWSQLAVEAEAPASIFCIGTSSLAEVVELQLGCGGEFMCNILEYSDVNPFRAMKLILKFVFV